MEDMEKLLKAHAAAHPAMEAGDAVKFLYQSHFGPAHLIPDEAFALARLREELETVTADDTVPAAEPLGGGLCRINLAAVKGKLSPETINRLFVLTAASPRGDMEAFKRDLPLVYGLGFDRAAADAYLERYAAAGYPMVSHTQAYRDAYRPAYRVTDASFARHLPVFEAVDAALAGGGDVTAAIDGRCGSGKSTLAALLEKVYDCNVFHVDDYFLPFERKTPERMAQPGGNFDRERLTREVILPLSRGEAVTMRRYDCQTGTLGDPVRYPKKRLNIVEGSYSLYPSLREHYKVKIFLTIPREEQLRRILRREGQEQLERFKDTWIPLEEAYFAGCGVMECADVTEENA